MTNNASAPAWYHGGTVTAMAMNLRLTDEQDRVLQALADAQHISKQEAAVRAIEAQAQRMSVAGEVQQWADFALERYDGLLDRLAQ
jgi:predicted transcriptional regulator